jgi:hypothetical protein
MRDPWKANFGFSAKMLAYAEANVDFGIAYAEMGPNRTLVQSIFQIRSEQESVKKQNEIQKKLFSVKGQKKKNWKWTKKTAAILGYVFGEGYVPDSSGKYWATIGSPR